MDRKKIEYFIEKCHKLATENGWWDDLPELKNGEHWNRERNSWIADKVELIENEAAEAVEALRDNKIADFSKYNEDLERRKITMREKGEDGFNKTSFKNIIKDTFEDEIADVFIRTCDIIGHFNYSFDNELHIGEKYIKEEFCFKDLRQSIRDIKWHVLTFSNAIHESQVEYPNNLSDIIITCIGIAGEQQFDLEKHVELKLKYNKTRGRMHGGKRF